VVFPPFDEDYLRLDEPAYQDWLRTIDYVSDKLCLPTLTLRVYMADHDPCGYDVTSFRKNMTKQQALTILSMWVRTFSPLSKLNEMKCFFVHLAWPFAWTRWGQRARVERGEWVLDHMRYGDQRIERLVMGDGYDSTLLKKSEVPISQWLEVSREAMKYGLPA